jgi:hypothetical protein
LLCGFVVDIVFELFFKENKIEKNYPVGCIRNIIDVSFVFIIIAPLLVN